MAFIQTNSFTIWSKKYVNLCMAKMPRYQKFTMVYEIIEIIDKIR